MRTEYHQGGKCHREADEPSDAAWADEEDFGAGNSQLPRRGTEAAQDHFSAGKGAGPIH